MEMIKMVKTKSKISEKIEALEQQLLTVEGKETEKYARIVGYYRAVRNWNKGKREEYRFRVNYNEIAFDHSINGSVENVVVQPARTETKKATGKIENYKFFYRTTCPNCPPVKSVVKNLTITGESINADKPEGFTKAAIHDIFTAPTVVFFDKENQEISRTSDISELKSMVAEFNL